MITSKTILLVLFSVALLVGGYFLIKRYVVKPMTAKIG
jgi:hypothetical protein